MKILAISCLLKAYSLPSSSLRTRLPSLSDDGYYYDDEGNRITDYGAGDEETAKDGANYGAKDKSSGGANNGTGGSGGSNGKSVAGSQSDWDDGSYYDENGNFIGDKPSVGEGEVDLHDVADNPEMVIDDWDSYKQQMLEDAGIAPTTEKQWYDDIVPEDQMNSAALDKKGEASESLQVNKTYDTVVDVAGGVPGTVTLNSVNKGSNASISGTITVNAAEYDKMMRDTFGDITYDDAGNEVQANYTDNLKNIPMQVQIVVTDPDWIYPNYIDAGAVTFNDDFTANFNVSADVPEGYDVYLCIQGQNYKL